MCSESSSDQSSVSITMIYASKTRWQACATSNSPLFTWQTTTIIVQFPSGAILLSHIKQLPLAIWIYCHSSVHRYHGPCFLLQVRKFFSIQQLWNFLSLCACWASFLRSCLPSSESNTTNQHSQTRHEVNGSYKHRRQQVTASRSLQRSVWGQNAN